MSVSEKFQLVVYDGDFSLPSFDVECTKSIVYTAIANVPLHVRLLNNVKCCTFYGAPSFIHKNLQFKSYSETVLYLKTLNHNIDINLSAEQWSESLAYTNLVNSKLKPVLEHLYWADQRNCDEFTNVWFMRALPLPFNYVHTKRLRERALDFLEMLYPTETDEGVIREYVNRIAIECLSSLSTRLGKLDYFYGSEPTSLDVVVYSYVAPLIKLPFPVNELSNFISMWPNLANLVKRIDSTYFPHIPKEPKYLKPDEKSKTSDDDISYVAILILTVSATSLVLGFAFSKGIISYKT